MVKMKSKITKKDVYAVDGILKFEFGNHALSHDVYWLSTGEIFPKQNGLSFDVLMGQIYALPRSVWESNLLSDKVSICDAPQYNSSILSNSKNGVYTNKDIVADYIKKQLAPIQSKINKPKF